jgi:hypothetical protein
MKFRIFCETCQDFKVIESLLVKEKCPVQPEHIIQPGSLLIIPPQEGDERKDYKTLRDELMAYVITNNGALPLDELQIAAKNFCLPGEARENFFPGPLHYKVASEFISNMAKSRRARYQKASAILITELTQDQCFELGADLSAHDYITNYLELGIEGKSDGDLVEGMYDYVTSYSGSTHSGAGLLSKSWVPRTCSLIELSNRVISVLRYNI